MKGTELTVDRYADGDEKVAVYIQNGGAVHRVVFKREASDGGDDVFAVRQRGTSMPAERGDDPTEAAYWVAVEFMREKYDRPIELRPSNYYRGGWASHEAHNPRLVPTYGGGRYHIVRAGERTAACGVDTRGIGQTTGLGRPYDHEKEYAALQLCRNCLRAFGSPE